MAVRVYDPSGAYDPGCKERKWPLHFSRKDIDHNMNLAVPRVL